nr:immunoglobulin light chain junction region [Mus musculus]NSM01935.1 immunoglobulin light chain junction region [Mus musculus]
CQQGDTLPRTF